MDTGGKKSSLMFENQNKRKTRGRTSASGQVANVFYDCKSPDSIGSDDKEIDMQRLNSYDPSYKKTRIQSIIRVEADADQEVNEGQGSELDKEICEKCGSQTYIAPNQGKSSAAEDPYVSWVCCDRCSKWYHAPCVGLDEATLMNQEEWYCCRGTDH